MAKSIKKYPEFAGYVNCYLEDSHLTEIADLVVKNTNCDDQMLKLLTSGYKVSYSWNSEDKVVSYTVQDTLIGRTSAGFMYTGNAPTYYEAQICVLYKHFNIMGGDWTPFCTAKTQTQRYR